MFTNIIPHNHKLFLKYKLNMYDRCDKQSICSKLAMEILAHIKTNIQYYKNSFNDISTQTSHHYQIFFNTDIFKMLDEKCDPSCKYLSSDKCSLLSLFCLEECLLILIVDDKSKSDEKNDCIQLLNNFISILSQSPYSLKCNSDFKNKNLSLYQLQFLGKGMSYLQKKYNNS